MKLYSEHILCCIGKWKKVAANIPLQIVDYSHQDRLEGNPVVTDRLLCPSEAREQLLTHSSNNGESMVHPSLGALL